MSERAQHSTGAVEHRGDGEDAARATKLRRSAWLLGLVALGFYVAFIVWNLLRPHGG